MNWERHLNYSFDEVVLLVSSLKAGEVVNFENNPSMSPSYDSVAVFLSNGFTPPDNVLEHIVGSSHTHGYRLVPPLKTILQFYRLFDELPEDCRSYVSPDNRYLFDQRSDGIYVRAHRRSKPLTALENIKIQCAIHGHHWVDFVLRPSLERPPVAAPLSYATVTLVTREYCYVCHKEK
jgi:hypothetical protein